LNNTWLKENYFEDDLELFENCINLLEGNCKMVTRFWWVKFFFYCLFKMLNCKSMYLSEKRKKRAWDRQSESL